MKDKIINFFKAKNAAYYVALVVALLTIITSFLYLGFVSNINEYLNMGLFALILIGGLAFIALSSFNYDRLGVGAMALCSFGAFIVYILTIYNYPLTQLMEISSIWDVPYIMEVIIIAVLLVISAIASNVLVYLRLTKVTRSEEVQIVK